MTSLARSLARLVFVVALPVSAQTPSLTTLVKPEAAFPEPFTAITAIRELSDGRVIVADRTEKTLQLIDLRAGTAIAIGTTGQGPGEYGLPGRLFALRGDTTLLSDILQLRYLIIGPNGKPGATLALDDAGDRRMTGLATAVDEQWRFYFVAERYDTRETRGMRSPVDQVVFRRSRGGSAAETLAVLKLPAGRQTAARTVGGGRLYRYTNRPLHPEDVVAFGTDGRVAVVRAADYHVEWIMPDGRTVKGAATGYRPIRVTEAERKAFVASQTQPGQIITYAPAGGRAPAPEEKRGTPGAGGTLPVPPGMFDEKDMVWPPVLPPFLSGAAMVAPDGRLWVLRARAHDDPVPVHDVFDDRGRLAARVALPKGTRLAGFGSLGAVYLARRDDDDLQYLERYRLSGAKR